MKKELLSEILIEKKEAIEIIISVLAISLALTIVLSKFAAFKGEPLTGLNWFFTVLVMLVTVGSGFILHEMAHKLVAIYYGAYARFKMWMMGLMIMFALVIFLPVIIAAPGAVYIYSKKMTKKQIGVVSVAGSIVNISIMIVFFFLAKFAPIPFLFITNIWVFGAYVNAILAAFNMLPIMPLDGGKVFAWNKLVWFLTILIPILYILFIGLNI